MNCRKHFLFVTLSILWAVNVFSQNDNSIQECPNAAGFRKEISKTTVHIPDGLEYQWENEDIIKFIFRTECDWVEELVLGVPHMRMLNFEVMVRNDVKGDCHIREVMVQQGQYVIGQGFTGPIFMFSPDNGSPCACPIDTRSKKEIQAKVDFSKEWEIMSTVRKKYEEKQYDSVIVITDNAIIKYPNDPSFTGIYYGMRADAKYKLHDYNGALADYSKTIQLLPKHNTAYRGRALAKLMLRDTAGACIDINKQYDLNGPHDCHGIYDEEEQEIRMVSNACEAYRHTLDGRVREGTAKWYFPDGKVSKECNYKHGQLEGKMKTYYENGNTASEGTYLNNDLEGIYYEYYLMGQPKTTGSYSKGKKEGIWKEYTEDGEMKTLEYKNDLRLGQ